MGVILHHFDFWHIGSVNGYTVCPFNILEDLFSLLEDLPIVWSIIVGSG